MSIIGGLPIPTGKDILRSYLRHGPPSDEEISKLEGFVDAVRNSADQIVELCTRPDTTSTSLFIMARAYSDSPTDIIPPDALVKIFLWHLSIDKVPPKTIPPVENDASERAWACLIGLGHSKFTSALQENGDWQGRIIESWPGILKWARFILEQRVTPESEPEEAKEALSVISYLVYCFFTIHKLATRIRRTDGLVDLLTRLWKHKHAEIYLASASLYSALEGCMVQELDDVCNAGGGPQEVAKVALGRLKRAMNTSSPSPLYISLHAHVLLYLSRLPRHPLTFSILSEHATWVVTRMLVIVSKLIGSDLNPESYLQQCVYAGFAFIRFGLIRDDSFKWVCQALDGGLLPVINNLSSMVESVGVTHPHLKECVRHILRETLPKHMVYKSVIKVMKREMEDVDADMVDRKVRKSFLKDDWMSLLLLTELRSTVAQLPKGLRRGGVACDNIRCTRWGKKNELLRCTGCHYVYFCSKECQVEGWPEHRGMCKVKNKQNMDRANAKLLFYESDAKFFRQLFGSDAHVHLPHLRKFAARQFPNEPGENFVICIDYTNPEYPAGTCSLKNIKTYKFQDLEGDPTEIENVNRQDAEMIKMVRRNPKEFTFVEGTFVYGEQVFSRNLIMRPNIWVNRIDIGDGDDLKWEQSRCENGPSGPGLLEMLASSDSPYDEIQKNFSELKLEGLD